MMLNRVLSLAVLSLGVSIPAFAQDGKISTPARATDAGLGAGNATPIDQVTGLRPRQPLPKSATVLDPGGDARLIVKFRDELKARPTADSRLAFTSGADTTEVERVAAQYGVHFVPAFRVPQAKLDKIEALAASRSRNAQPDLAGIMYVDGPRASLAAVANALNRLDAVEFADFVGQIVEHGGVGPGRTGACCLPAGTCVDDVTESDCNAGGGSFRVGETCADQTDCTALGACCLYPGVCIPDEPNLVVPWVCAELGGVWREGDCESEDCTFTCGDEDLADCTEIHAYPFCNNNACCSLVGDTRPFCVDDNGGFWDFICVALANIMCNVPPADRCNTPFNAPCFQVHPTAGCNNSPCCYAVCDVDPFCCTVQWDITCVTFARDIAECQGSGSGPTPDFSNFQGYLRRSNWDDQLDGRPDPNLLPLPPDPPVFTPGWLGEGLDLFAEGPSPGNPTRLVDDPNMLGAERYLGMYGLGRQFADPPPNGYGIGSGNGARGAGIKVAVIDNAYFVNHEDLSVTPEPGQTMITIPDVTDPGHGTAVLGIVNALYNGFGMCGIAPDAQAFFFPLTSVEQGPRLHEAFINCFDALDPGDVVVCPFGVISSANLNTGLSTWLLLRLGTDLGLTMVVSAGDNCINLDDTQDLGDSGAIIVGSSVPGRSYCRMINSNFFRNAGVTSSQRVHVCSWGDFVASTGGSGNLFLPDGNWDRSYTTNFNGTSAASAQVAGVVACLQGFAKQFFGIPLPADRIRTALMITGFPECLLGFNDSLPCGPDVDPDQPPNRIGPYLRPRVAAAAILTTPEIAFDQSPLVRDIFTLRGNSFFGNVFSIKASDNNYFVTQSLYTDRNQQFDGLLHLPEANTLAHKVQYLATGYTADYMIRAQMPARSAPGIAVTAEINTIDPVTIVFVEAYDFVLGRWIFIGNQQLGPVGTGGEAAFGPFVAAPGDRFISPTSLCAYIRLYVLAVGNPNVGATSRLGSTPPGGSSVRVDWVNVGIDQGFAAPLGQGSMLP